MGVWNGIQTDRKDNVSLMSRYSLAGVVQQLRMHRTLVKMKIQIPVSVSGR